MSRIRIVGGSDVQSGDIEPSPPAGQYGDDLVGGGGVPAISVRRISRLPLVCALVPAVVAGAALFGWATHNITLVALSPNLPAMSVPTAFEFLISSFTLWLVTMPPGNRPRSKAIAALAAASVIVLIGLGSIALYMLTSFPQGATATGSPILIDSAWERHPHANRMSPNTAINFVFLGLAFLLVDKPWREYIRRRVGGGSNEITSDPKTAPTTLERWPFQLLALIVILNGFLALVGQLYGVLALYGLSRVFGMAVSTAALFLMTGTGLLATRPNIGFVAIVLANSIAGRAARGLLPFVVAVPVILGSIVLMGFRLESASATFLTYLLVVCSIGLLVTLFWRTILALQSQVELSLDYEKTVSEQAVMMERASLILRQRRFVRDMLSSVTAGRLQLCDSEADLPPLLPESSDAVVLVEESLRVLRRHVAAAAQEIGLSAERAFDLQLATGEASMNSVVHGGGGIASVHADRHSGRIQVRIRDEGQGIPDDDIHRATLEAGWSGAGSFGHGFFLMLRAVDRVYLLTGASGTTIVLEQTRAASEPASFKDKGRTKRSIRDD